MDNRRVVGLLVFFHFAIFVSAVAQTVTGRVSSEGAPLVGASVFVRGTTIGTSTDVNGQYTLRVSPGTHDVVFSFVGYSPRTITVTLREGETRTLNIELQSTAVKTDVIVVVGTRTTARTVTDSPLPIDVLTAQELTIRVRTRLTKCSSIASPLSVCRKRR